MAKPRRRGWAAYFRVLSKFATFESPQSASLPASLPLLALRGISLLRGGIGPLCPRGAFVAAKFLSCYKLRGKRPEKPKRFSWSVQGGPEGNRNPSGLVSFCQRFLLEKQKKMLMGSRKFLIRVLTLVCVSLTTKTVRIRRGSFIFRSCLLQPFRRFASAPLSGEP